MGEGIHRETPFLASSVGKIPTSGPRLVVGGDSRCSGPTLSFGKSEISKLLALGLSLVIDSTEGFQFTGLTANQSRIFSTAFVTPSSQTSAPETGIMEELRDDQFSFRSQSLVCRGRGQLFQGGLQFTGLSCGSPKHSQLGSASLLLGPAPRIERSWTSRELQHTLRRGEWSASRIDERSPLARQHPTQQTRDVK